MRRALKLLLILGIGLPLAGGRNRNRDSDSGSGSNRSRDQEGKGPKKYRDAERADEAQDMAAEAFTEGQVRDANNDGRPDLPTGTGSHTRPSKPADPNNEPRGTPTEVKGSPENQRSLRRENEAAKTLSEQGYDVEQNPPPKPNGKEPDYKIEGEYFDCYSPKRDDPGRIRDDISSKVKKQQSDRIVLNLDDSNVDVNQLRSTLERRPVGNLQEVKIVQNGQVIDFYPF